MLQVHKDKIPLTADANGVLRVSGTRVPMDAIVDLYDDGASAEEIVEQFDALSLSDVHLVLGYYLRHETEVKAHLEREDQHAAGRRRRIEAEFSSKPLRKRLRKAKQRRDGS
jgi:uncharacterized protein (DUF433 family)